MFIDVFLTFFFVFENRVSDSPQPTPSLLPVSKAPLVYGFLIKFTKFHAFVWTHVSTRNIERWEQWDIFFPFFSDEELPLTSNEIHQICKYPKCPFVM